MYSETLICFELLYFIKILKAQSLYLENVKNEPWRGANFIVRPRAQNCLATPLDGYARESVSARTI